MPSESVRRSGVSRTRWKWFDMRTHAVRLHAKRWTASPRSSRNLRRSASERKKHLRPLPREVTGWTAPGYSTLIDLAMGQASLGVSKSPRNPIGVDGTEAKTSSEWKNALQLVEPP